ncbi:hypothetical protein [Scytonema sp. PRP1]|uniref:hypothetical protein n=1 Tax=Scytonema sp. PRP1 TaxID=3120513 RepID=UPI002FCF2991
MESTYATSQRLIALILLMAIAKHARSALAYSCAVLTGRTSRQIGLQKYVGRLQELKRSMRRHSAFWIGLYGFLWVGAMEFWSDLAIAPWALRSAQSLLCDSSPISCLIFRKVYALWRLFSQHYSLPVTPSAFFCFQI